ncbi:MAG: bifunctional phosphopantothenoylcysteine decarboxylase/phosphopantothenate--cysteine ligase CoaBC [candidate division FCPU426 bacterium]
MLAGRRILLGVTGSIAAYKAAELARQLVRAGCEVTAVMTANACRFITPLTLRTLTQRPVVTEFFADPASPVPHISLAQWAELVLVAPATADSIARAAQGRADDLLAALLLDTRAPVIWAPAMNVRMWEHPLTQAHVRALEQMGHQWVLPAQGELACGETGRGRLAPVEEIVAAVERRLSPAGPLAGKRVLITAGPTREPWDAVRFLSNRSTGKMGLALAAAAARRGAHVTLVLGPVELVPPPGVRVIPVITAVEMHAATLAEFPNADVVIAAAAVSDFRPAHPQTGKLKKGQTPPALELLPNPDILKELGERKTGQILVGFAAETEELEKRGRDKLAAKKLDLLIANQASGPDDAFASDEAAVLILDREGGREAVSRQSKARVADLVCDRLEQKLAR